MEDRLHIRMTTEVEKETIVLVEEEEKSGNAHELVVYNDDINTFDWVIQSLVEVVGHTQVQAEQLSLLIHFKGKAGVKEGTIQNLRPLRQALVDRGLSAVIEGGE